MRSVFIERRPRWSFLGLGLALLMVMAGACKPTAPEPSEQRPADDDTSSRVRNTGPARDAAGATAGARIAAMAPAAVEILDVLGMLDRVVGVGDFVQWPPAIRSLPRLGPFHAPNIERVLGLRADLLVTAHSEAAAANLARLDALGVPVLALRTDTYEGTLDAIHILGQTLGADERARAVIQDIRARMQRVTERAARAPRRRVLAVVGHDPLYVAGPGSHVDALITAAGGENVAGDALSPYQLVSLESMLERRPEVIIDTSGSAGGTAHGQVLGSWAQWPFLPAVAGKRVFWVDPLRLLIPGPRLPEMAEMMGRLIHPEIFGEPSADELGPMQEAAATEPDAPAEDAP